MSKFSKNWKVEYSGYLSKYGFESPGEYRDSVDKKISRWNRVIKRMNEGLKMTDDNKKALDEINKHNFIL